MKIVHVKGFKALEVRTGKYPNFNKLFVRVKSQYEAGAVQQFYASTLKSGIKVSFEYFPHITDSELQDERVIKFAQWESMSYQNKCQALMSSSNI